MRRLERAARTKLLVDLWALAVALVLVLPMFSRPGYGLARDLIFVPERPLDAAAIGMSSSLPRAVPVEAWLGLLSTVVDGGLLFRAAVLGVLCLAGWGAHRMFPSMAGVGRATLAGLAIWNPFVVERLALGQWALLAAYAAAWWLIPATRRFASTGSQRDLARVTVWLALASLTPTGGIFATLLVTVFITGARVRRTVVTLGVALLMQLPWILPSLLSTAVGVSDPDGVAAFAARAENVAGTLSSLVGLGGIWDATSVPASRAGPFGIGTTIVVVVGLAFGLRHAPFARRQFVVLASISFLLAAATVLPFGEEVLRAAVQTVPGAGLLRDSQKWLLGFAVVAIASLGLLVDRVHRRLRRRHPDLLIAGAVAFMGLPMLLLPDATTVTWSPVTPVDYPADYAELTGVLDRSRASTEVLVVPWRSYRVFDWGRPLPAAEPATRWFSGAVVVADDLYVGGVGKVSGEDPRAKTVAEQLEGGAPVRSAAMHGGLRWVLVYTQDTLANDLDLTGLTRVYRGEGLDLYSVPAGGAVWPGPSRAAVGTVATVDAALLLLVAAALVQMLRRGTPRTSRR